MNQHLDQLCQRFWDLEMEAAPLAATALGDHRFDDRLPPITDEDIEVLVERANEIESEAKSIDPSDLSESDRTTRDLLLENIENARTQIGLSFLIAPVDALIGPHVALQHAPARTRLRQPEHAAAILDRYRKIPEFLTEALQRSIREADKGKGPTESNVAKVLAQLDGYLASDVGADPFLTTSPPPDWDGADDWQEELASIARDVIRPAFAEYRKGIAQSVGPLARSDTRPGLAYVPDGDETYAKLVRLFTSLDLPASEIHELGLQLATESIASEIEVLGRRVLGTDGASETCARLRNDPELRYGSAEEMVDHARSAIERAWSASSGWFGLMPKAPCDVVEIPAAMAPGQPPAYYFPPAPDGSRSGMYYLNTHDPQTRQRFDAESMHFHEAVPGHHLQITIASELDDLPDFRKHSLEFAYAEGWGLYAELLADEMGLYSSDLDRLGRLSSDAWRACRLVVDTGLHLHGWTREQGIDFIISWSAVAPEVAAQEVDRYIGMPGQALAYKIGQQEILRLRDQARKGLGNRFKIADFHNVVLGQGGLSLGVLRDQVERWIAQSVSR